jgi:hypothetical protein
VLGPPDIHEVWPSDTTQDRARLTLKRRMCEGQVQGDGRGSVGVGCGLTGVM